LQITEGNLLTIIISRYSKSSGGGVVTHWRQSNIFKLHIHTSLVSSNGLTQFSTKPFHKPMQHFDTKRTSNIFFFKSCSNERKKMYRINDHLCFPANCISSAERQRKLQLVFNSTFFKENVKYMKNIWLCSLVY